VSPGASTRWESRGSSSADTRWEGRLAQHSRCPVGAPGCLTSWSAPARASRAARGCSTCSRTTTTMRRDLLMSLAIGAKAPAELRRRCIGPRPRIRRSGARGLQACGRLRRHEPDLDRARAHARDLWRGGSAHATMSGGEASRRLRRPFASFSSGWGLISKEVEMGGHPGFGRLSLRVHDRGRAAPEQEFNADVAPSGSTNRTGVYAFNRGQHPMVVFDRDGNFCVLGRGVFSPRARRSHGARRHDLADR